MFPRAGGGFGDAGMGSQNGAKAAKRGSRGFEGRRILVIEDDWYIADAMASLLENEGAVVLGPAATLAEAAQLAGNGPIDLAVVDLNLQGERADNLVAELAGKGITVVVVTAYNIVQAVADKAFAILQKPVATDTLLDTLYRAAA
jgi:DNA-binding NtrC family response regulator